MNLLNTNKIPKELRELPRWMGYRLIKREGNKPAKKPINLVNGKHEWGDDDLLVDFKTAIKTYKKFGCSGLGFSLKPPYVGIDIDSSIDLSIARSFDSYTEWSPSKKGYHVIVKGEIPKALVDHTKGLEIYTDGRWFTVTGNKVAGYPSVISTANGNLASMFKKDDTQIVNKNTQIEDSWLIRQLESIEPGAGNNGRTPTFVRVINRLKAQGLIQKDVEALLLPWADKYDYIEKFKKLLVDQYVRYPVKLEVSDPIDLEEDISAKEFLRNIEIQDWIVDKLITKNSINLVAGLGGSCKSWLVIDLCIAFALGESWLGKFPIKKQNVLYLEQERSKADIQKRFSKLFNARGVEIPKELCIKRDHNIKLNTETGVQKLIHWINKYNLSVICIDCFSTSHSLSETDTTDIQLYMEKLKDLREKYNLTFIFVDHEKPGTVLNTMSKHDPNAYDTKGSGAKINVVDSVMTVRKISKNVSTLYHTKNNPGELIDAFTFEVKDIAEDKTKLLVEGY